MKFTKKLMSVVLAAILMIGALAVPASAESIYDSAVNLPSGEKKSFTLSNGQDKDYKVVLSQKGTLTINISANIALAYLKLYDSDGNILECSEYDFTVGSGKSNVDDYLDLQCKWNKITENFTCTAKYELEKGTYYIRLSRESWGGGNGKTTLKATYDSNKKSDGKISTITLEMEVGNTVRLCAVVEPADAEVKWSSAKPKVATVSASGKVTAKKEGSTIITAKCGSSVKNIQIIVV